MMDDAILNFPRWCLTFDSVYIKTECHLFVARKLIVQANVFKHTVLFRNRYLIVIKRIHAL